MKALVKRMAAVAVLLGSSMAASAQTHLAALSTDIDSVGADITAFGADLAGVVIQVAGAGLVVWGGLKLFRIVRRGLSAGGA